MLDMLDYLREEGINPAIIKEVEAFRGRFPTEEGLRRRVPEPRYLGCVLLHQHRCRYPAGHRHVR